MEFSEYIKRKRLEKGLNAKKTAQLLSISPAYLSGLENGNRNAPSFQLLVKIAEAFDLNDEERCLLYDLAAKSRQEPVIAKDLTEYIYQEPIIIPLLRYTMKCQLREDAWTVIFDYIKSNYFY